MAKIIVVPPWLSDEVNVGQPLDIVINKILSAIESDWDIINYHKCQIEFIKLIMVSEDKSEIDLHSMYNSLLRICVNDNPELEVYKKQVFQEPIMWDMMVTGAKSCADVKFEIEPSVCGKAVYVFVKGKSSTSKSCIDANQFAIICKVLEKLHGSLRNNNGLVDKGSVFRENPILSQLYVKRSLVGKS